MPVAYVSDHGARISLPRVEKSAFALVALGVDGWNERFTEMNTHTVIFVATCKR